MTSDYKPNRIGTVIVFKKGVDAEEAKIAMQALKNIVEREPMIREFDDRWGGPVWYIP